MKFCLPSDDRVENSTQSEIGLGDSVPELAKPEFHYSKNNKHFSSIFNSGCYHRLRKYLYTQQRTQRIEQVANDMLLYVRDCTGFRFRA